MSTPYIFEYIWKMPLTEKISLLLLANIFTLIPAFWFFKKQKGYKLPNTIRKLSLAIVLTGLYPLEILFLVNLFQLNVSELIFEISPLIQLTNIILFVFFIVIIFYSIRKSKNLRFLKSLIISLIAGAAFSYIVSVIVGVLFLFDIQFSEYPYRNILTGECKVFDNQVKMPFWFRLDFECIK